MARPEPGPRAGDLRPAGFERNDRGWWVMVALLVLAGMALRVLVWHHRLIFEDHDSIGYLRLITAVRAEGPARLLDMGPTGTPVYPALGALLTLPGWGPVVAARVASLLMSLVLLITVPLLGRPLVGRRAALFGTALVAFAPPLVDLGPAVLTEPSYLALVYLGLLPLAGSRPPYRWWIPLWAGLFLGLAFLDRIEAVGFLVAVPLLTLLWFRLADRRPPLGATVVRVTLFVAAFLVVAVPQVLAVSRKAGTPMINGRQVWSALMTAPGQGTYLQRIYGLDFDPGQVNVRYAMRHPEVLDQPGRGFDPAAYLHLAVRNGNALLQHHFAELVGTVALVLIGAGVVGLLRGGRFRATAFFAMILAAMLSIPLLHEFSLRHIVVAAPLLLLLAGKGINELALALAAGRGRRLAIAGGSLITALVVLSWIPELRAVTTDQDCNDQYCRPALTAPARLIGQARAAGDSGVVATRRMYLPYFAGSAGLPLPWTDTDGLIRYLSLNQAGWLFLDSRDDADFPFYASFAGQPPAGLRLVYRGRDRMGRLLRLYRVELPAVPDGRNHGPDHR